jgi:hypothetical protein
MSEKENPLQRFKRWYEEKESQRKTLIRFEHRGQIFTVRKDVGKSSTALDILDEHGLIFGFIRGSWIEQGEENIFYSKSITNASKKDDHHVPYLVQTAIGEIVAQRKVFTWHSDSPIFQTDNGQSMYQRLSNESNTPGSRFYGRIQVEAIPVIPDKNRYIISPHTKT